MRTFDSENGNKWESKHNHSDTLQSLNYEYREKISAEKLRYGIPEEQRLKKGGLPPMPISDPDIKGESSTFNTPDIVDMEEVLSSVEGDVSLVRDMLIQDIIAAQEKTQKMLRRKAAFFYLLSKEY
ncbi:hypothetical protein MMC14_000002 [Varicellaria rhodocarpa]|nr:hypothetical protein [Varicellaria rhodocarpa]